MLSLRHTDLIAPLVRAVQEQQATIESQRDTIESLRADMAELKRMVARGPR